MKRKWIFLQEIHMLAPMWHRMEQDNFGSTLDENYHDDDDKDNDDNRSAHCRFIMSLVRRKFN